MESLFRLLRNILNYVTAADKHRTWILIITSTDYLLLRLSIFATVILLLVDVVRTPISDKTKLVLSTDKFASKIRWRSTCRRYRRRILPPTHPKVVRVIRIMKEIVEGLHKGLGIEDEVKVFGFVPGEKYCSVSDKDGKKRKSTWFRNHTSHLEGLDWQIMVVESKRKNARNYSEGRILIYTGVVDGCSDAEVATTIGHEVAHTVAQHSSASSLLALFLVILFLSYHAMIFELLSNISPSNLAMVGYLLRGLVMEIRRRNELEADYIGLMLMAMAGYDPKVAPLLRKKRNRRTKDRFLSTHPCGAKRAKVLEETKVMGRAVTIYERVKAGLPVKMWLV